MQDTERFRKWTMASYDSGASNHGLPRFFVVKWDGAVYTNLSCFAVGSRGPSDVMRCSE